MFKNLKLGAKIGTGFGALILIAIFLGSLAVFNMNKIKKESIKLAKEYVPEVDVANNVRGASNRVMYEMRGFGFTEEEKFKENAKVEMKALDDGLKEASELADNAIHLTALKNQLSDAEKAKANYYKYAEETFKLSQELDKCRKTLDENAEKYMKNSSDFIVSQNLAFKKDLTERQKKISIVSEIVNLGAKVRVTNFKAQCLQNMDLMKEATALLEGLKVYTGKLRAVTKDQEDINRINNTENAANKYSENMKAFVKSYEEMNSCGNEMNDAAADYMKNCNEFLELQNTKMKEEFMLQGANLEERHKKITLINDIIDFGNEARVNNFKAQANRDPELMKATIERFKNLDDIISRLRRITMDSQNTEKINIIEKNAKNYSDAMKNYLKEYLELTEIRQAMDIAAGSYVKNCEDFLTGQQEKLTTDMTERHLKITWANDVINFGNDTRIKTNKSQALRNPELLIEGKKNFPKINENLDKLLEITRDDTNIEQIAKVRQAGENYRGGMEKFLENWFKMEEMAKLREEAAKALIEACKVTADAGIVNTKGIANEAVNILNTSSNVMVTGLIIALITGVLLAFFITKGITGPINNVIKGLSQGSEQVSAASNQVSSSSQQMAEGASEQASSLEEISSSLEEMASMTRQNADNAKQANATANEAKNDVDTGNAAMQKMSSAIGEIKKSSDETAKIIKTIDEIAFQTNLLALNAAVEAARAGEAGKGFAVVAEEVRNLAMRSAEAAKNTAALIEGSQKNAENGVKVTNEVAEILGKISNGIQKVNQLVREVSAASDEQAQGIEQVNTAVAQMDQVTQNNASNSEESASAAEELSSQAVELKEMVNMLIGIVEGSNGKNGSISFERESVRREFRKDNTSKRLSKELSLGAKMPKSVKTVAKIQSKKSVKPEEVIPLDDEELKDF